MHLTNNAEILADSIASGVRLTTLLVTMPRSIIPQLEKHRVFSISMESSRAIPVKKRIRAVMENPVMPIRWGEAQSGMVADEELDDASREEAECIYLEARDAAVNAAERLLSLRTGKAVQKEVVNRLLEPFAWVRCIISATEWANFFALRLAKDAQPEMQRVAQVMKAAMDGSEPKPLETGEWHLPLILMKDKLEALAREPSPFSPKAEDGWRQLPLVAAARCARISYLTHKGVRDVDADMGLYEKLASKGHMTPLEHPAVVADTDRMGGLMRWWHGDVVYAEETRHSGDVFIGNFRAPWVQLRKTIPGEAVFRGG